MINGTEFQAVYRLLEGWNRRWLVHDQQLWMFNKRRTISIRWRSPTLNKWTHRHGSNGKPYCLEIWTICCSNPGPANSRKIPRDMFSETVKASNKEKMLKHHTNFQTSRNGRIGDLNRCTVPMHLPTIGFKHVRHYFNQCTFASPVFT